MDGMFETFDHTADLGLRIQADDLSRLFQDAGTALTACLVENPQAIQPLRRLEITLPPDDVDYLLFDWLKTLLYHFEVDHLLAANMQVRVDPAQGLHAVLECEAFDPQRHLPAHEVKAITYHDLRVEQTPKGWLAEVIVDI